LLIEFINLKVTRESRSSEFRRWVASLRSGPPQSGYGERVFRALVALMVIWLGFALLYSCVGFARWDSKPSSETEYQLVRRDEMGQPLPLKSALTYSIGVMSLQKPDPKPATNTAYALVVFETILGPVQAALLALAIRRKFMR
jgi:hypothetical protein